MDGGGDGDASVYSSNGQSIKRLKQALKTPCSCGCSCTMPFRLLSRICLAFWALPKVAQDSILWSVQSTGKRIKRTYSIEGILYKRFWIFVLYTVTWYHVMYIHKEKITVQSLLVCVQSRQTKGTKCVAALGCGFWASAKIGWLERGKDIEGRMTGAWSVESWLL